MENLRNQTIICGTMDPQAITRAFMATLESIDAKAHAFMRDEMPSDIESEEGAFFINDLFSVLDSFAPDGCYFGAHPDDGADFGFWSNEEAQA